MLSSFEIIMCVTRQVLFGPRTEIGHSLKIKIQATISYSCDWQKISFFWTVYLFLLSSLTGHFFHFLSFVFWSQVRGYGCWPSNSERAIGKGWEVKAVKEVRWRECLGTIFRHLTPKVFFCAWTSWLKKQGPIIFFKNY